MHKFNFVLSGVKQNKTLLNFGFCRYMDLSISSLAKG